VPTVLRIAAAVIVDDAGRVLLVRKRGTEAWMQPGGKIDEGEQPAGTLARELHEELGLDLDADNFTYWGRFHAPAANEKDHVVDCEMYEVSFAHIAPQLPLRVAAEIEELLWFDLSALHALVIAPLSLEHVFPRLGAGA
jgi:8-oxo-dGTP pyrophosphatase MutT (NUDIX family)